jgi:hypothetical protein
MNVIYYKFSQSQASLTYTNLILHLFLDGGSNPMSTYTFFLKGVLHTLE